MKRRGVRRHGRLIGTKYDFQVPNPPYDVLIHRDYSFKDTDSIRYYTPEPGDNDAFVQRQKQAGVSGEVFWTLRPIKYGEGRRMTPFPHLGQRLKLIGSNGKAYAATVVQDYRLPRRATGWVILKNIYQQ